MLSASSGIDITFASVGFSGEVVAPLRAVDRSQGTF